MEKSIVNSGVKQLNNKVVTKKRIDIQFNYLCRQKHSLGTNTCAFCKLITAKLKTFFVAEEVERLRLKDESVLNRNVLRWTLLTNWSYCQPFLFKEFEAYRCFDVILPSTLLSLIIDESLQLLHKNKVDFNKAGRVISRRNRIYEVGHFAALFLQARIRKFLTRMRLRRILLERFEMVAATKMKEAFFYDTWKGKKLYQLPAVLKNERPATPNTIRRRLIAEQNKGEVRIQRFQISLERVPNHDIFFDEDRFLIFIKQMALVYDLVSLLMHRIHHILVSDTNPLRIPTKSASPLLHPVWLSFSPPAASSRQLGWSIILNDTSIDFMQDKPKSKSSCRVEGNNYNRKLAFLEKRAWEAMICSSAEEVVMKLLHPDLAPAFESVINIIQDPSQIWKEPDEDLSSASPSYLAPISFQIRPAYPDRNHSQVFRLFFYKQEFVAGTVLSPFAYYSEVLDIVYNSFFNEM